MAQDLWEIESLGGKKMRRNRVVNIYNNNWKADQVWEVLGRTQSTGR